MGVMVGGVDRWGIALRLKGIGKGRAEARPRQEEEQ
jgi:hypothetical protein